MLRAGYRILLAWRGWGRGTIYPGSRPAGVTTRSPRMVTERLLTRLMLSLIHTKQLVACNLSQAIFVACSLTVHTVRQIAETFTCKIFSAITLVLSMEEEIVIMHCYYITCDVTSSTPTTRTELLDMDIAKTSLRSTSSINLIYQHPLFSTSVFSDIVISFQCQLSK